VMIPARNHKDLEDVPPQARKHLDFIFLDNVDDAIRTAIKPDEPPLLLDPGTVTSTHNSGVGP
jgi:ATP-dependent Lon protease